MGEVKKEPTPVEVVYQGHSDRVGIRGPIVRPEGLYYFSKGAPHHIHGIPLDTSGRPLALIRATPSKVSCWLTDNIDFFVRKAVQNPGTWEVVGPKKEAKAAAKDAKADAKVAEDEAKKVAKPAEKAKKGAK